MEREQFSLSARQAWGYRQTGARYLVARQGLSGAWLPPRILLPSRRHMRRERKLAPTTVLVIDDDPEMRALLHDVLERAGHRVLQEASGEGVILSLESEHVDVVILDKEMPGVNGLDLLAFLRHRWPKTPVIVITAFGGPSVAADALRLGAARYLEKPFRVAHLVEMIRTLTRSAAARAPTDRTTAPARELPF